MGESEGRAPSEFEAAVEELERIVARLDREELELDEALRIFREGVDRLRTATRLLDDARGRVRELVEEASGDFAEVELELPDDGGTGGETRETGEES